MKAVVLGLLAVALPASAHAQNTIDRMQNLSAFDRMSQNIRMQGMEQQQDAFRETQNPRVIRRAEDAARLINAGDCAGALDLARRANDQRLMAGITRACRPGSVSVTDTSAATPATTPND